MSDITTRRLSGGLQLVVEPIASVNSVALQWRVPLGSATEAPAEEGLATMIAEMLFRGAGDLDARGHSDALDRAGVQRLSGLRTHHLVVGATMLGSRVGEGLPLLATMMTAPALTDETVDPVRRLCLQSLDALDDDPQHLVMLRLRGRHLPPPFNRHGFGAREVLETADGAALRSRWAEHGVPGGGILSAAGAVDPDDLAERLETLLGGWSGTAPEPQREAEPARGLDHHTLDTSQVHIGLAYDAPREAHPDAMLERVATSILGGSTSGRLFTEVRAKRSLSYSVGASYRSGRDSGFVTLYAGTTPERAQETLDVCVAEIDRLRAGVRPDEFDRAVVGLKSHLIMQGESTAARAAAIAEDHFRLGRARTLEEIAGIIDGITLARVNAYLRDRAFGPFTVASIGPEPLAMPHAGAATSAAR